jgi:hypothetical protein
VKRPARAHIFALLAALAAVVAVSALWLAHFRTYPRGTGFDDLTGIIVPFGLLFLVGVWLVVRAIVHGRFQWRVATVIVAALALAYAQVAVYCGPVACFTAGSARLMGWFLVGGAALAALVHHGVLNAFVGEKSHAA